MVFWTLISEEFELFLKEGQKDAKVGGYFKKKVNAKRQSVLGKPQVSGHYKQKLH